MIISKYEGKHDILVYSKTPLIRNPGDQLNMFELRGFQIRGGLNLTTQNH